MRMFKKYIKVFTVCDEQGTLSPLFILWSNGVKYAIDKYENKGKRSSPVGGCGTLYKCTINGKERNLYYEIDRWFIESNQP